MNRRKWQALLLAGVLVLLLVSSAAAVLDGTGLKMTRYFFGKGLQAAISAVLAYLAVQYVV